MTKVKSFFTKIMPSKRKIIQLYSALLFNANIKGYLTGTIFDGVSKNLCVPGLNCYSCPGAIGACPLGSIQNALAASKTKLPTYILGIILLYSIILGRTICGFLCPMGLIQELLYKIKTPKLKKNKITRILSYFKYILLFALVIILPLIYGLQQFSMPLPAFCKYICPAGTLEGAIGLLSHPGNAKLFGMLGPLFTWKFLILVIFIVASIFIFRFFCRFLCPLGAIYGLFNKLSIIGVKVDMDKCNHCNACITNCKMDIKEVGDHECIQCGECQKVCHCNAISWKSIKDTIKLDKKENKNIEIIEEDFDENISNVDEVKQTTITKMKKILKLVGNILAVVVLIVVLILVNFPQKTYEINDICDELVITLNDNEKFDITADSKSTILCFYESLTKEEIEILKTYTNEELNLILISNIVEDNIVQEFAGFNIKFASDEKGKLIKEFTKKISYPYSVYLDKTDMVLINSKGLINLDDYAGMILPTISGKTVGKEIGNICINKTIPLIGSDETFSVARNRGKIIIINFWFTSCTPCVQELPHFNKLYEKYKDDVTVIAIHEANLYEEDPEGVNDFVENQFGDYTILFGYDDVDSPYYEALGGTGYFPVTMIVDQEGFVTFFKDGSMTEEALENEIIKLLD